MGVFSRLLSTSFPTFTPLLKEVGAICSSYWQDLGFSWAADVTFKCQKQPHLSTLPTDTQPAWDIHLLLAVLWSTNKYICLPPLLLFPGSLCFALLTFWEWELRLTNCSPLSVLLSTCTHLCEKQTKLKSSLDATTPPIRHICSCTQSLGASLRYFILVHILYPHELWSLLY